MAASVAAAGPSSSPVGGDMSSPGPRPQPLLHQQDFYLGLSNRSNGDSHVIVRGGGDHVGSDDDEDDDEDEGPISATARAENGNGSDTAGATSVDRSAGGGAPRSSPNGKAAAAASGAANPLISSTEKCKVCKEPAAKHIHYGSVTCFSCRAFFRRSIQNQAEVKYVCKRQGGCDITLRSRKNCQKCRLEKCLTAGMKPSWVLSDEERDRRFRKTREKKRRKIQEQKDQTEVIPEPGDSSPNQSARQTDASSPSISEISPPPPPPPPPHLSPPQPPMIASTSSSPPHLRPTPIPPTLLAMPPPYHPLYPGSLSDCRQPRRATTAHHDPLGRSMIPVLPYGVGGRERERFSPQPLPLPHPHPHQPLHYHYHHHQQQQQHHQQQQGRYNPNPPPFSFAPLPPPPPPPHPSRSSGFESTATTTVSAHLNFNGVGLSPPPANWSQASLPPPPPPPPHAHSSAATNTSMTAMTMSGSHGSEMNSVHGDDSMVEDEEYTDSSSVSSGGGGDVIPAEPCISMSEDEVMQIRRLADAHDKQYRSVPFGEELIKEMVMASVFSLPLSPNSAMTAYKLMIQRVTKVAQAFEHFMDMEHETQTALMKVNSDLVVSLRGAVFFDEKKKGLDQILYSLGVDDVEVGKRTILAAMRQNNGEIGRISYKNFNSIQKVDESSEAESRYNRLLARVGSAISIHPELVKLVSYIILFSGDFTGVKNRYRVETIQEMLVNMVRRFIFAQYPRPMAVTVFGNVLASIADVREISEIKKHRTMAQSKAAAAAQESAAASNQ